MNQQSNPSIHCTVVQCQHIAANKMNCSLDEIQVGTHEANPTQSQCTDCLSFRQK